MNDDRSSRADVRNPLLQLDAVRQLQMLPPESQMALRSVLLDLRRDAQARATESWRRNKAPMAAYWKAVAVMPDTRRVYSPADDLRRAFVEGAAWWEFNSQGFTMWNSDREEAETEAEARFPGGKPRPAEVQP